MSFYELLALAMKKTGMTAAELSQRTGLNQPYFSKLKSKRMKDVTWERALKIIDALGMTPSEFAALEDDDGE